MEIKKDLFFFFHKPLSELIIFIILITFIHGLHFVYSVPNPSLAKYPGPNAKWAETLGSSSSFVTSIINIIFSISMDLSEF